MKAAIYCRVSSEDQKREGTSLPSQLKACRKLAHDHGYEVREEHIVQEVYSGLILDRPDLTKLRGWLQAGEVNAVVIYSSDRFSRDGYDFLTLIRDCKRANVELLCVTEPLQDGQVGELLSYVRGWASKLEAEKIRERTMRGVRQRASQGKIPIGGTGRLYGYTYIIGKGEHEGIRYINEGQAKWVKEMYRWLVDDDLTVNGITYRLRALGIPTPGKSPFWRNGRVHEILTNLAYTGKTYAFTYSYAESKANPGTRKRKKLVRKPVEEWVEIPGATPAIISQETFELAQAKLQQNKRLSRRNAKRQYLLSGYVFCSACGRRYRAKSVKPRKGENVNYVPYYQCPGGERIVSPTRCQNRRWNANHLEKLVWEQIESLLTKPEEVLAGLQTRKNEAIEVSHLEQELDEVNRRLKALNKEQEQLLQWALKGFPEQTVVSENKRINEQRAILELRNIELETRIEQAKQTEVNMESIERFCELVRHDLGDFTFEDKRLALEGLQIKVWIDGSNVNIEGALPVGEEDIESATSRCSELEVNNSFPFSIPVLIR